MTELAAQPFKIIFSGLGFIREVIMMPSAPSARTAMLGRISAACLNIFLAAAAALAQGDGTIHGTVTDPSGLPVPKAKVTATLEERGTTRQTESDGEGTYILPLLPVGTYRVDVEAQGFKLFRSTVTLTSNQNARVDAKLQVGHLTESVTVTAEAPQVDSRSSTVGALIDSRRVVDLPTNGRNVIALAQILPGVADVSAPQTFTGDRSGPTVSVSGARANENLFLFDGTDFNGLFRNTGLNYPPPDAIREVKVLTNSFSAEYGRNAGSIFNVVTRSGTNQIHGRAWEFTRNSALNARNFFLPTTAGLIQNQFGGSAGSPIRRDKLFIFGSYEGLRIRPASASTTGTPLTAAERNGDFSRSLPLPIDPASKKPFPNNQIPSNMIDSVAKNILANTNLMPLPNTPNGQFVTTFPKPQNNDNFLVRLDYNRGKHTTDGHYNYNLATQVTSSGDLPAYSPLSVRAPGNNITLGDTWVLRPDLINSARLSYNRFVAVNEVLNHTDVAQLGANFPAVGIPPALAISGRVTLGSNSSSTQRDVNQAFQFSDRLNWTRGRHSVKSGFELLVLRYLNRGLFLSMGDFRFTGSFTKGNAAADFLLGQAATMSVASPMIEQAGNQTNTYYYFQDDWRIRQRLTLNLGLRYELPLPWVHPHDWWGTLHPGQQSRVIPNAPLGMVFPGDAGVPRGLVPTPTKDFAPRLGFAWDVFGDGRTAVRGAYGIFYEPVNVNIIQNQSQPFRYTYNLNGVKLADPLSGQPPLPTAINLTNPLFVGTQSIIYPDPNLHPPYAQQFNLTVQRQIVRDLVVDVAYVGTLGRRLQIGVASNPAVFGPGASTNNIDQRRILQPYGSNVLFADQANSNYNALQVQAKKRMSSGFSLQFAYTYSRAIDEFSNFSSENTSVPQPFDLRSQYGPSDFNSKHIVSLSWIWNLPMWPGKDRVVRALAGGWEVNGLVAVHSGMPLNLLAGQDIALSGTPNQRPNQIGDPNFHSYRSRGDRVQAWFDRTAFMAPAPGTYGNVGRNSLVGPDFASTNLAVFKNIPLRWREGAELQFRSEFFNLFNGVNFNKPNTTLGSTMGRVSSAGAPREIQFALKLLW